MSELKERLEYILEEKKNKIIPNNILKGINIFDIEGNLDFTLFNDYEQCLNTSKKIIGNLPQYTQLEYIESDGNQFIQTEDIITDDDKVIITVSNIKKSDAPILSATSDWSTQRFLLTNYNNGINWFYGNDTLYITNVLEKHTIEVYRGNLKVDEVTVSNDEKNRNVANKTYLKLFGQTEKSRLQSMRLYDLKLYRNDELISHLIPCKNNFSGEIGVLDIVKNIEYNNKLNKPFIAGSEIDYINDI